MDDKFKTLHDNLLKDGYDIPEDVNEFKKGLSEPKNLKALHENILKDGYDVPKDLNEFSTDLGLKKKEETFQDTGKNLGNGDVLSTKEKQRTSPSQSELPQQKISVPEINVQPVQVGNTKINNKEDYNKLVIAANKTPEQIQALDQWNKNKQGLASDAYKAFINTPTYGVSAGIEPAEAIDQPGLLHSLGNTLKNSTIKQGAALLQAFALSEGGIHHLPFNVSDIGIILPQEQLLENKKDIEENGYGMERIAKGKSVLFNLGQEAIKQADIWYPEDPRYKDKFLSKTVAFVPTLAMYAGISALSPSAAGEGLLMSSIANLPTALAMTESAAMQQVASAKEKSESAKTDDYETYKSKWLRDKKDESELKQEYEDLRKKDTESEMWDAWKIAQLELPIWAFSLHLPKIKAIEQLNKSTGGAIAKYFINNVESGIQGAVQMGLSQIVNNLSAQQTSDYQKNILDDVYDAGSNGAAASFVISMLTHAVKGAIVRTAEIKDKNILKKAVSELDAKAEELKDVEPAEVIKISKPKPEDVASLKREGKTITLYDKNGEVLGKSVQYESEEAAIKKENEIKETLTKKIDETPKQEGEKVAEVKPSEVTLTPEDMHKKAILEYGVVKPLADGKNNFLKGGWLMPEGELLNISPGQHDKIETIFGENKPENPKKVFQNSGAIKLAIGETGGIDLTLKPTEKQLNVITEFAGKHNGKVEINIDGEKQLYIPYEKGTKPEQIENDLMGYYKEGVIPENAIDLNSNESKELKSKVETIDWARFKQNTGEYDPLPDLTQEERKQIIDKVNEYEINRRTESGNIKDDSKIQKESGEKPTDEIKATIHDDMEGTEKVKDVKESPETFQYHAADEKGISESDLTDNAKNLLDKDAKGGVIDKETLPEIAKENGIDPTLSESEIIKQLKAKSKPEPKELTKPITVWKNSAEDTPQLTEGHNKFQGYKEKGEDVPVRYVTAENEAEAVAKSVLNNIKDGDTRDVVKTDNGWKIDTKKEGYRYQGLEFDNEGNVLNSEKFEPKESEGTGISQKSLEKTYGEENIKRGEGLTPEQAIEIGRNLIKQGANPEEIAKTFKETKKISGDDVAIVRAKHEELVKKLYETADKFGIESKEYKEAKEESLKWAKEVVKPMATEWHKVGEAFQGETDINTGSYIGMDMAFQENYGKEMTEKQSKTAKKLSDEVKMLNDKITELEKKHYDQLEKDINATIESKKTKEELTKERKAELQESIKSKLSKLANVKSFGMEAEKTSDVLKDIVSVVKDIAELGSIELEAALKQLVKQMPNLKNIINKNKDEIKKQYLESIKKEQEIKAEKDRIKEEQRENKKLNKLEEELKQLQETGKLPEREKATPKEISDAEKELKDKIKAEKDRIKEEQNFNRITTQFVDKKDTKFTPQEIKDIWDYAKKNYIDKGSLHGDMIAGVSKDLGLSVKQVNSALIQPKASKVISDEMYNAISRRNKAIAEAKIWLQTAETPKAIKVLKALPGFFFGLKTFGHGTVGFETHAGMNLFKPSGWNIFFPNYLNQYKFSYGGLSKSGLAAYERQMQELILQPRFAMWKRAGLTVDPRKVYDEYQGLASSMPKFMGKLTTIGDRGFNALKTLRFDMAESIYKGLSEVEKADPNTVKEIAHMVNLSTGSSNIKFSPVFNTLFFAPKLEAARWEKLITQPIKAADTFIRWDKMEDSKKAAAKIFAKRVGEQLATYTLLLAANQAIMSLSGSKNKVNITDPTKHDFMRFKIGDKVIDHTGGMNSTINFIAELLHSVTQSQKDLKGKKREDKLAETMVNYARGKASPIASTVWDFAVRHTYNKNVLPPFEDKPEKGRKKLTWKDYLLMQQTPIPVAEAFNDIEDQMKAKGMSKAQIDEIMDGIFVGIVSGMSGTKIKEQYKK